MKNQSILLSFGVAAVLTFLVGCDSKPADSGNSTTNAASAVATEAGKAVEATTPVVQQAVSDAKAAATTDAKAAATTAASDTTAKANTIIDQAKVLVGQNKYTDALNSLQQLSSLKLTDEQQKIVNGLKEQIQKAMAAKATTDGANAVGDLLKK